MQMIKSQIIDEPQQTNVGILDEKQSDSISIQIIYEKDYIIKKYQL